jgi:hypothetical protein
MGRGLYLGRSQNMAMKAVFARANARILFPVTALAPLVIGEGSGSRNSSRSDSKGVAELTTEHPVGFWACFDNAQRPHSKVSAIASKSL